MNELFKQLLAALKGTSAGTKAIAAVVALGMAGVLGLAGVLVNRPHLEIAFSGLADHEVAKVNRALSEAGIGFEVSQPPGPYVVFVDRSERTSAYMAVYGAGALDKPLKGILSDAGVASVFNSAEERAQSVRKREWEEMEKMLEELDFVVSARVRTSPGGGSSLGGDEISPSASVTLRLAGNADLTRPQATTVANLVSRGLGVEKRFLTVSDQTGLAVFDGDSQSDDGVDVKDLLQHQTDYDRRLSTQATQILGDILGANKARVSVSSEWDYAQTTTSKEMTEKGAIVQETKTSQERPLGSSSAASNAVGLSANVLAPNAENPGAQPVAAEPLVEKSSEERKDYEPSRSKEERVRLTPELKRLSVALFLDESIDPLQKEALETAIKASVGYDAARDAFSSVVLAFAVPPATEEAEGEAVVEPTKPSPMMEMLLQRGVEIASALVFLVLLAKSLKGPKKGVEVAAGGEGGTGETTAAAAVDPELLARAQIDELLRSDPSKVGEILSRWAREETVTSV